MKSFITWGPEFEVIRHFSCSIQLSIKFQWLIKAKMLKNKEHCSCVYTSSDGLIILQINVKMPTFVAF